MWAREFHSADSGLQSRTFNTLPTLWDTLKALLNEVRIERERGANSKSPHSFKACAIHQAQLPAPSNKESAHTGSVALRIYPDNTQDRNNVFLEGPNCFHPHAMLKQGNCLYERVIRANHVGRVGRKIAPAIQCPVVVPVIGVHDRVECGGIHKDT